MNTKTLQERIETTKTILENYGFKLHHEYEQAEQLKFMYHTKLMYIKEFTILTIFIDKDGLFTYSLKLQEKESDIESIISQLVDWRIFDYFTNSKNQRRKIK